MSTQTEPIEPRFDPGLTQQYTGKLTRAINRDGSFNVRRTNGNWRDRHPYLFLISVSWTKFCVLVTAAFLLLNLGFSLLYVAVGLDHLKNSEAPTQFESLMNAFFFSAHTLTTVGYGNMWPVGPLANSVAALESLVGVLVFAIAAGLMFGRFSRPSARFGFSETALIAPYQNGLSLQFRVANRRSNIIINVDAQVLMMWVEVCDGQTMRRFEPLPLERREVLFFALPWTVVHPITEKSPLFGKTLSDLRAMQMELIILVRGFDDTFGQNVHARYSYRFDEVEWGRKFASIFQVEASGDLLIDLARIGSSIAAPMPEMEKLT